MKRAMLKLLNLLVKIDTVIFEVLMTNYFQNITIITFSATIQGANTYTSISAQYVYEKKKNISQFFLRKNMALTNNFTLLALLY